MSKRLRTLLALLVVAVATAGCTGPEDSADGGAGGGGAPGEGNDTGGGANETGEGASRLDELGVPAYGAPRTLNLTSDAFENGTKIPETYTCDGDNLSPPLAFGNVSEEARTLALVVHDPDAPLEGGFTHWIFWNLDANTTELPEGADVEAMGAVEGTNTLGLTGYTGPCPPTGEHRYVFRAYALDAPLDLAQGASLEQLAEAMDGHVLAEGELIGTYQLLGST